MFREKDKKTVFWMMLCCVAACVVLLLLVAAAGKLPGLTARFLALIGSTKNIAIVKSVSEHQPTAWDT